MPSIEGVFAAAVTSRRTGMQDINLGVMWELIDFLCAHKVDGIALPGPVGEFIHFSEAERMRMMGLAPRRSRVPVLMDVSHSNLDGALELGEAAAASGAAGVLLMPPYFYRYNDSEVASWYQRFAEAADPSLPVFAVNAPQFTNALSAGAARLLIQSGAIQGVYEVSGDPSYVSDMISLQREHPFTLLLSDDNLCEPIPPAAASAVVSGAACAVPELSAALRRAIATGKTEVAMRLSRRLREFLEQTKLLAAPVILKEATAMRGFKLGPHAVPLSGNDERIVHEFRTWFEKWLPATLGECKDA